MTSSSSSSSLWSYQFESLNQNKTYSTIKNLFRNTRKVKDEIEVVGIGRSLIVDILGDLPGFGPVYFHPDAVANILCFNDMAKKKQVNFDS